MSAVEDNISTEHGSIQEEDTPSVHSSKFTESTNSSVPSIQELDLEDENLTSADDEVVRKKEALAKKKEPVKILCIGVTGIGKSTLINAMMGDTLAVTGYGPDSVQSEVEVHRGEYEGIEIEVYDTTGFSDAGGKSEEQILHDISKACSEKSNFDLILICLRMDSRADDKVKKMLSVLGKLITEEMWKRTVVVLTFANYFLKLENVRSLTKEKKVDAIRLTTNAFRKSVKKYTSGIVKEEIVEDIPFCLTGVMRKRKLSTTDDWLVTLWEMCIIRCSDNVREFLKHFAEYRLVVELSVVGVGMILGGVIGGAAGSIVPIVGTITGVAVGVAVGVGAGLAITTVGIATGRHLKSVKEDDGIISLT